MRSLFPDFRTHRGLMNRCYAVRAIQVLNHDPAFAWLCASREAIAAGTGGVNYTIMSELGRVEDATEMRALAAALCEEMPATKQAVAMLRRQRTKRRTEGSELGLANALIRCVNAYLAAHPETTWSMARVAVLTALHAVEEAASEKAE